MKKHPYVPFILTAAALWGVIGIFLRILTALGFSSLQSVAIRTVGAAIQMGMFLLLWRPGLLRIDWRDLWMFCGTGIASLLFFNWCYFGAIQASNLSVAVVLLYTSPIFVALLSAVC
ncbi:MAG: EamA family transporter, partial [Oscillospiraceae bacterium]